MIADSIQSDAIFGWFLSRKTTFPTLVHKRLRSVHEWGRKREKKYWLRVTYVSCRQSQQWYMMCDSVSNGSKHWWPSCLFLKWRQDYCNPEVICQFFGVLYRGKIVTICCFYCVAFFLLFETAAQTKPAIWKCDPKKMQHFHLTINVQKL